MTKMSKVCYSLALLILMVGLVGCELRRDEAEVSDPGPVSELPPTLAPLNAETNFPSEATVVPTVIVPTVINVEATATVSAVTEGDTAALVDDGAAPTSIPIDLSSESSEVIEESAEEALTEEFNAPNEETVAEDQTTEVVPSAEEAIVVDATTSDDLPVGGPVAANPPYSDTAGDYSSVPELAAPYDGSYTVRPGDTLFSIARRFGTSVDELMYANALPSDVINIGQILSVPGNVNGFAPPPYEQPTYQQPPLEQQPTFRQPYFNEGRGASHIVAPGETLFRIALRYSTSVDAIAAANGIPYPYIIQTGQQLIIPGPDAYAPAPADGYPQQPGYGAAPQQPYQEYGAAPQQPYQAPQGYDGTAPQQPYQEPYQGFEAAPQQPYDEGYGQGYDAPPQAGGYYPPQDNAYANPSAGTHTIAPGETLYSIATRYGTSAEALAAANGLNNPNQIFVGQVLFLP